MFQQKSANESSTARSLTIDYRIISLVLLLTLAVCIFLWKPWVATSSTARKITVNGQSTVKGTPDEYQVSPYFEFTGDRAKATADANVKSAEVTAKLKEIGVKDTEIKSNTSSYDKYVYTDASPSSEDTLTLSYTITLTSKDTAQKVQDFFLNTNAKGQISPYASFSEAKQKELAAQARQNAIDDAKAKATKSAEQVEAKIGKVVTISDDGSGGIRPYAMSLESGAALDSKATSASIPVQSGQDDFTSTVTVEYELR